MGRHSVPDDDAEPASAPTTVAAPHRPSPRPRHARPDEAAPAAAVPAPEIVWTTPVPTAEPSTSVEAEPAVPAPAPGPAPGPGPAPAKAARPHATAADLALLRRRGDVRARVVAAVVVPFLLYSLVMVLIGRTDVYLIWIWIPLVSAGVLGGSILDAAHRKPPPSSDG